MAFAPQKIRVPARRGEVFVGPLDPYVFNDPLGEVGFTVSRRAGLSVAALQVAR
jgi:hypothetical protein